MNDILSNLKVHKQVDAVYLDFAKAFDSVVHSKLLYKLKIIGFGDSLVRWINSFLVDRFQCVKVNDCMSEFAPVLSGIPQGSVLGPILFMVYINDALCLAEDEDVHALAYADDIKSYAPVSLVEDCSRLQSFLYKLGEWAKTWQLSLAPDKCKILNFSTRDIPINYEYNILGTKLEVVNLMSDLGVNFDTSLTFSEHINKLYYKARSCSLLILRCFHSRKPELLFRAFKTYVIPAVEYCSPIWCPYKLCEIKKIEAIQRRFTKKLSGMENISYMQRLKILKADTLELRRIKADIIMYYKIIHGCVTITSSNYFKLKADVHTRGQALMIYKETCKNNCQKYAFKNRSANIWNKLPSSVVNAPNLKAFKNYVQKLQDKFFTPFLMIR